jgi:RNA polymerase sigma factor (sigma-70 family)
MPFYRDEAVEDRVDLTPFARRLLGERQDAEDVAQDVWLLLQRQPPGHIRRRGSWLGYAIRNVAARSRLRNHLRAERERIVARFDQAPSVLEELERKGQLEFLSELVDQLIEPYRQVVRLHYLEEREIDEIAALFGRSSGTVRSQLKRGLDQLRVRLGVPPERKRVLWGLLPWPWHRAGERMKRPGAERLGWASLVAGIAASILAFGVFIAGREDREVVLAAAAPRIAEVPASPMLDPALARTDRASVSPSPAPGQPDRATEEDGWGIDVEGVVLDHRGKSVSDALVFAGNEEGSNTSVVARSDLLGRYRVERVDRRLLIWAEDPRGIASSRHMLTTKQERALDLKLGAPAGPVIGRVLSCEGVPVSRAEVVLSSGVEKPELTDQGTLAHRPAPLHVWTDDDGGFRIGAIAMQSYRILVLAEGYPPLLGACVPDKARALELTLPPPCALQGQIVRPDGTAAAGVRLELDFPHPLPCRQATADENGDFALETLAPGPCLLRLQEDPTGSASSCFVDFQLAPGERLRRTVRLDDEHTIHGRAVSGDKPLAGWIVELEEQNRDPETLLYPCPIRRSRTTGTGSFAFPSCCPDGDHVLRLFDPGSTAQLRAFALDVRAGQDAVVLRAAEGARLSGSLVARFESQDPRLLPPIATLRWEASPSPLPLRPEPSTGVFSAQDLEPGIHQLFAWVPRLGVMDAGQLEIHAGQPT